MKKTILTLTIAILLTVGVAGTALAAAWAPSNSGTTRHGDTVTLDNTNHFITGGTSYENSDLGLTINTDDTITFDFTGLCAAGSPRMFIEVNGAYYNTFDDPATTGCGVLDQGGDSGTVVYTYTGPTGTIGHAGLVHDGTPTKVTISNVTIGGDPVPLGGPATHQPQTECKNNAWQDAGFRNQGDCVSGPARGK